MRHGLDNGVKSTSASSFDDEFLKSIPILSKVYDDDDDEIRIKRLLEWNIIKMKMLQVQYVNNNNIDSVVGSRFVFGSFFFIKNLQYQQ